MRLHRCSRSCYNCPSCTAPLAVTQISAKDEGLLKPSNAAGGDETFILQCHYCNWSSLEIGLEFSKANKITEQLNKQRKALTSSMEEKEATTKKVMGHDDAFTNLASFYKGPLNELGDSQNPYPNSPYSSPANLVRIMSLYGGLSYNALKKSREKPQPMREAMEESEGLATFKPTDSETELVQKLQLLGWDAATTGMQRLSTPFNNEARFTGSLWPAATPLRTRRAKRCKTCRHIIARPDPKVGSMRYKIRLLAMTYIPRISIRPLNATTPLANPAFYLRSSDMVEREKLQPHQIKQYVLTIRNPLFENVKISLATPATTPGKVASRVTILCPSFTVGPAGEVWDEALSTSTTSTADGGRKAAMASLTGSSESSDRQPEAGKIWEKTRNSTSVIVEIIPGSLKPPLSIVPKTEQELADEELRNEDDDVLEVPVYVRAEWEAEVKPGESVHGKKEVGAAPGEKVKKEVGYWVVLGVGRIAG